MKKAAGLLPVGLMLFLFFSAILVPVKVQAQNIPGTYVELKIINSLNDTDRVDEPVVIDMAKVVLPEGANPDSYRITNATGGEVPSQFDNLTEYGYSQYLVFPATVPRGSNVTYQLHYSTEKTWPKANYTAAVPLTPTDIQYVFTAETYSGVINKSTGVMANIKTTHSGILLTSFGISSIGSPGWNYGWYQSGSNDSQTTFIAQGPVRSIVVSEGEMWYNDVALKNALGLGPFKDPGSSNWTWTTIYLIYKDRVQFLTHQVYEGTMPMSLAQVRVGDSQNITWMLNGKTTFDAPTGPYQNTVQAPKWTGYSGDYIEWNGELFTFYPIRDKAQFLPGGVAKYGRWVDVTSENQSFGFGAIFTNSSQVTRVEVGDGRSWGAKLAQSVLELSYIQYSAYPSGTVIPGKELWYDWFLLPHENTGYNYTQAEADKVYSPLGFTAGAGGGGGGPTVPVWVVYGVFFGAAAVVVVFFARKIRT